jgi:hypothetical protein
LELPLDEVEKTRRDGQTTPVPMPVPLPSGVIIFLLVTLVILLILLLVLLLPVAQLVTSRVVVMVCSHAAVHGSEVVYRCWRAAVGQPQWPSTATCTAQEERVGC